MSEQLKACPCCGQKWGEDHRSDCFIKHAIYGDLLDLTISEIKLYWQTRPIEDAQAARIIQLLDTLNVQNGILKQQAERIAELEPEITRQIEGPWADDYRQRIAELDRRLNDLGGRDAVRLNLECEQLGLRVIELERELAALREEIARACTELKIAINNRHVFYCDDIVRELSQCLPPPPSSGKEVEK